jgi:CRP-like cAMP-binding protein
VRVSSHAGGAVERVLALRVFPGFARLPTDHLALLAEYTYERYFSKGDLIASPGRMVTSMHFVRSGIINVLREGVVVRSFSAGAVVGGLAGLTRDPKGQHLVAGDDTDTFEVAIDDMEDFLEDSFPTLVVVMRGLAGGVLEMRRKLPRDAGFVDDVGDFVRPEIELNLVERILFARRLLAYGHSRVEAMAELVREMELCRFAAGQVVYREGDGAVASYLVYSGGVRCTSASGQSFVMGPDSVIGGIDSMANAKRWYTATAQTDVVALRSAVTSLIDVVEDHPDMGLELLRVLAGILKGLQDREYEARAASR